MIHPNNEINFRGQNYMNTQKQKAKENTEITALVEDISNTTSHGEFHSVLKSYVNSNPSAEKIGANCIKNGEYYIQSGLTDDIEYLYKNLRLFQKEGCTICPNEVIMASNNNGFSVLITRFESAEDENLETYDKKNTSVPSLSKEKAYNDLTKLADMGYVNADLLHNGKELKVVKPTQRIICDDWTDITPINDYLLDYAEDDSRQDVLRNLREIIY